MKKLIAFAAIASAALAAPAHASPLLFSVAGTDNLTFTLDSNPTPSPTNFAYETEFDGVAVHFNGSSATMLEDVVFAAGGIYGGGFEVYDDSVTAPLLEASATGGSQVFGGTTRAPTFTPGTSFSYTASDGFLAPPINDTLTIKALASSVPETATWAMMILGMGAIGFSMRRRRGQAQLQTA